MGLVASTKTLSDELTRAIHKNEATLHAKMKRYPAIEIKPAMKMKVDCLGK